MLRTVVCVQRVLSQRHFFLRGCSTVAMAGAAEKMASTASTTAVQASAGPALIDEKGFADIQRQMQEEDASREALIKRSRDVLKLAKNSIYALQRGEVEKAAQMVAQGKEIAVKDLLPSAEAQPQLRWGALGGALEEWAEAAIFVVFREQGRVPSMAELGIVNKEEYLGGIMDFTGELNRYAVLAATRRDIVEVQKCREVVDQLHAQLMLFEFRNGNLRRKYDAVKYTLKKLEQIIYELTLASAAAAGNGAFVPKSMPDEPMQATAGEGEGGEKGGEEGFEGAAEEGGQARQGGGSRGGRGGKRPRQGGAGAGHAQ